MSGIVAATAHALALRINTTSSMPLGLYREVPLQLEHGARAVFCLPEGAARLGLERGYLPEGRCPGGAQELVKEIVDIPGDEVVLAPGGLTVNSHPLPGSAVHPADHRGRALEHAPFGARRVGPNEVWVLGALREVSWDSRYFGPIPVAKIRVSAVALLTFGWWKETPVRPPAERSLDPEKRTASAQEPTR